MLRTGEDRESPRLPEQHKQRPLGRRELVASWECQKCERHWKKTESWSSTIPLVPRLGVERPSGLKELLVEYELWQGACCAGDS